MLTDARQKMIETIALRDGEVIISHVAKELGVSIETIRRDINALCEKKLLTKVHGGAVPLNPPVSEASYNQRKNTNSILKNKLGLYAAKMVKNNQVVALSTGSTMEAVAAHICNVKDITVLTNSIPISDITSDLLARSIFEGKTLLLGGNVNPIEHLTFGTMVDEQIDRFYADVAFVSAGAISTDGAMNTGQDEGAVCAKLISRASKTILVAESKKLNKRSTYRYAKLSDIDVLITDDEFAIGRELTTALQENHVEVHIVK